MRDGLGQPGNRLSTLRGIWIGWKPLLFNSLGSGLDNGRGWRFEWKRGLSHASIKGRNVE